MCEKFLRGTCDDADCLLRHATAFSKNQMAPCRHFLKGICTNPECPYPHVKVSSKAEICVDFVNGYCPKGPTCKLRHELPSRNAKTGGKRDSSPNNTKGELKMSHILPKGGTEERFNLLEELTRADDTSKLSSSQEKRFTPQFDLLPQQIEGVDPGTV